MYIVDIYYYHIALYYILGRECDKSLTTVFLFVGFYSQLLTVSGRCIVIRCTLSAFQLFYMFEKFLSKINDCGGGEQEGAGRNEASRNKGQEWTGGSGILEPAFTY